MTQTLTTERLKTIAAWRAKYGADHNIMIPAKEAEAMANELMANRDAQPVMTAIPDISSIVVNDAAWRLHDSLTEHGPLNGRQFNNLKGCLYEALKIVIAAPPAKPTPDAIDIFADQVIGTKTKVIRMPAPLNVPQEGIRVYLNADELFMQLEKQGYVVEVSNE